MVCKFGGGGGGGVGGEKHPCDSEEVLCRHLF